MKRFAVCITIVLTLLSFSRQYELGRRYSFDYETSVLLNEPQTPPTTGRKDVGFRLNLVAHVVPVWQNPSLANEQILELKIEAPKLWVRSRQGPSPEGFVSKSSKVEELKYFPFYIHRKGGGVERVLFTDREPLSWVNIKKGIAALFQYQPKDGDEVETDTSGQCTLVYRTKGLQLLHKIKSSCKPVEFPASFNHSNQVLGARLTSQRETTYEFDQTDGAIKTCSSVEIHVFRPELRQASGAEVISKQILRLKDKIGSKVKSYKGASFSEAVREISKRTKNSLVDESLQTTPDPKECIACKSLSDLVQNFYKALSAENLGTQSAAIAFLRLLGKMRESDENTISAVLKNRKYKQILLQLIDIAAAAQTLPSHNAAKRVVTFTSDKIEIAERYLLALSLTTHPLEFVIEDLLKLHKKGTITDQRLAESLALTIASMTKTFASHKKNANRSIVGEVRSTLLNDLSACLEDGCAETFIRALRNLQCPRTIPVLLEYAKGSSRKQAVAAMRAVQTMPAPFIDSKVSKGLEEILFELDAAHDSSVRAMAAEILLRWEPRADLLRDVFSLLLSSPNNKTKELNTLLLGHIQDLCEKNPKMDKLVRGILSKNSLWNYHILSQGGLSSAFSRPILKDGPTNATFYNMLEISGGILKRSTVDVFIDAGNASMRLLSFGIFAGGLSMFGSGDEDDTDEEAHAGIEITLLETQLRPFVFFKGQGELMSHVWAGTASERTTALQGSILLHDHSEIIPLQNGLNADLTLTGAASYDFAGQVQVSLWNQNAHSFVEVGASGVMQGQARVDNAFIQTMVEFNVGSQTQLNLISDMETSPEIMMCLQMVQPDFDVIDSVRKFERIPDTNYVLRKYKRKATAVSGKTYVMNRKNTELCNKMFSN